MKKHLFLIFSLIFGLSCQGDDGDGSFSSINDITISNFPILDGSDSTKPLRQILMCKLLGYGYEWQISPFVMNPDEAPHLVMPSYTCSESEEHYLRTVCMLSSNTHQSFVNLIDGKAEVIIAARSISRDEKAYAEEHGVALIEKPIARDALTFMVNPANPVENLTIEQIQGIYTGDIVNWSELGGPDEEIVPYVRNRNSGSQEKFETMVMDGLTLADFPEMHIGRTMMTPYYQLEHDEWGIAFTPYYYYSVIVGTGSTKAIGVNGIAMTKENIASGDYPYTTSVYAAVRSDTDRSSMAYMLFDYLTSEEGQAVVGESGYVPLLETSGLGTLEGKIMNVVHGDNEIENNSPFRPVRICVSDLSGRIVYSCNVDSRVVKMPPSLSGFYVISLRLENGGLIHKKVML